MCAREHDRRFFGRGVQADVLVVTPTKFQRDEAGCVIELPDDAAIMADQQLIDALEHLDEVGSLLNPTEAQLAALRVDAARFAAEADGIVIYNKVKPHTDFKGEHESGLLKMMAIGLAKHIGCSELHRRGFDTFAENIPKAAKIFLERMPVLFGVGVVQNAYDEISEIRVYPKEGIMAGDRELLRIAKERFPRFRFDNIDVLVVDRIGKDISGEGADPNVTGRGFMPYFKDDFHTRRLFVRGLSEQSHHNACGLGLADITTRRCLNSVDWESTWVNLTTNMMIDGAKIPLYQNSDQDALRVALRTCPRIDYGQARIVRIRDTLSLNEFEVSEGMIPELLETEGVEIIGGPYAWQFDGEGYLKDFE